VGTAITGQPINPPAYQTFTPSQLEGMTNVPLPENEWQFINPANYTSPYGTVGPGLIALMMKLFQ
jgi:hypothetical protein